MNKVYERSGCGSQLAKLKYTRFGQITYKKPPASF
jgi:hypothetical protein